MQRVVEACSRFFSGSGDNSTPSGQTRVFGFPALSIRDLLKSKTPHCNCIPLSSVDGVNEVGEVKVSDLEMEGETDDRTTPEIQSPALCDVLHGSVHDKEHSPMMRAVLCCSVCKVYRFPTEDHRWLLVREQMSETPLSFSLPKLLLGMLIQEHSRRAQEVRELHDLSPHLEELRRDVINHCDHMTSCYQATLTQLEKLSACSSFKASSSKADPHLQFVPTNLHSQRMEVTSPDSSGVWYEVITVGAPADHHQGFKQGGLKRLLSKNTTHRSSFVSYSQEESAKARELLTSVARLQPLVFGLAEELLAVSLEVNAVRLQKVLDALTRQTEEFIHALKDELVKSSLLSLHKHHFSHCVYDCNGTLPGNSPLSVPNQERRLSAGQLDNRRRSSGRLNDRRRSSGQQDDRRRSSGQQDNRRPSAGQLEVTQAENKYDEEEWDTVWGNVGKSLHCIIAMVDRLKGKPSGQQALNRHNTGAASSPSSASASSWQEQLLPLVVTLRDCVREAVGKASAAMTFVLLQGAAVATVGQGSVPLVQRHHAVFSQALSAVVCGFILKLHGGLEDANFLRQLHSVGVLAQFECLISTFCNELGMLEDMEVGVANLNQVAFTLTEAKTDQSDDLLPTLTGTWDSLVVNVPLPSENFASLPQELKDGHLIQLHPVFFNIGINQKQSVAESFGDSSLQENLNQESCERLKVYCDKLRDKVPQTAEIESLPDLLSSLDLAVESRKRKNVEVLWLAAAICRRVNGVRLTSCKSAKDRTAMSVTLEQCLILKEKHGLSQQHFIHVLDTMRRDGCRLENTQKNIGCRKFAFCSVQLLSFPKLYRPPEGSYGHTQT